MFSPGARRRCGVWGGRSIVLWRSSEGVFPGKASNCGSRILWPVRVGGRASDCFLQGRGGQNLVSVSLSCKQMGMGIFQDS